MTKPETLVIEETTSTEPKLSKFKKHLNVKNAAIAAGTVLALAAGAIWFAVKRLDEEDFDDELAKLQSESAPEIEETPAV